MHYEFSLYVLADVRPDHRMQIIFYEFANQVNVPLVLSLSHSQNPHQVLVAELVKKEYFTESPLGIDGISECVEYFLNRNDLSRALVNGLPNNPV
jgi:hypothetical protein